MAIVGAGLISSEISNGSACALLYAREGASVFCVDRSLAAAEGAVRGIVAEGGRGTAFQADVRDAQRIAAMTRACLSEYGQIDVLHNNVGKKSWASSPRSRKNPGTASSRSI